MVNNDCICERKSILMWKFGLFLRQFVCNINYLTLHMFLIQKYCRTCDKAVNHSIKVHSQGVIKS